MFVSLFSYIYSLFQAKYASWHANVLHGVRRQTRRGKREALSKNVEKLLTCVRNSLALFDFVYPRGNHRFVYLHGILCFGSEGKAIYKASSRWSLYSNSLRTYPYTQLFRINLNHQEIDHFYQSNRPKLGNLIDRFNENQKPNFVVQSITTPHTCFLFLKRHFIDKEIHVHCYT